MNRSMPVTFKAKDEFGTDEQREAWQKGFDMVIDAPALPDPVPRWLEETLPEAISVRVNPLSMDMLHDELEQASAHLEEAVVAGFWTAVMDKRSTGLN